MKLIIDISEVEYEGCKLGIPLEVTKESICNKVAKGIPFNEIWTEIEELQQDVLKSSETPLDSAYNISIGISMALGVIKKYTAERG